MWYLTPELARFAACFVTIAVIGGAALAYAWDRAGKYLEGRLLEHWAKVPPPDPPAPQDTPQ